MCVCVSVCVCVCVCVSSPLVSEAYFAGDFRLFSCAHHLRQKLAVSDCIYGGKVHRTGL